MADIIDNRVEVSGSPDQIERFFELMQEDFNFNHIVPTPKELRITIDAPRISAKASQRLKERYGLDSWKDWAKSNWGTPRTPWDVNYQMQDDWLLYTFQTYWGPPEPIYSKLQERFPKLTFEYSFSVWKEVIV